MIKLHQLLTYAGCALLWCSTANDIAAQSLTQTEKQFTLRKADVPIEGEYIDAVFYADPVTQELRPKIVIRNESVDFITREGSLRNRVVERVGETAKIAANGEFIGFYHPDRFCVYKDTGDLLWQDAPPEEGSEDVPERRYRLSSQGIVCNVLRHKGKIIFHDQQGAVMAEHSITNGMSRTLNGEWSPDGQYFLASAGMRITQLHLFDARGAKQWDKRLEQKYVVDVEFSPKSKWIFLGYHDFSDRTSGNAILTLLDGSIVHDLIHADLLFPSFSVDEKYVFAKGRYLKDRPGQQFVLFDIQAGAKLFEIFLPKYIIDFIIFSEAGTIYVLHDSEIVKLDMSGAAVGKIDFGQLKISRDQLRIHDESTADRVLIRGHKNFLDLSTSE